MVEEWKEVLGFDVLYEVSNLGRVRSRYSEDRGYSNEYVYLKPLDNGHGYLRFNWRMKKRQRTVYLHRLVAEAFLPNPDMLPEVNHKDENKANCRVDNLEWCDHKYNASYGTKNERMAEKRVKPVQCIETGVIFRSARDAGKELGVTNTAISNCLKGRSKTAAGYTWRYADVDAV